MSDPFNGTFLVEEIDSAIELEAVIIGVPFEDNIEFYPTGASSAPEKIRDVSYFFSGQSFAKGTIHKKNVLDLGNLPINLQYNQVTLESSKKITGILLKQALPIILGGDHSIALGTVKGIQNSKHNIDALVWIDAHVDLMDTYPESEKFSRATVLKRIIELNVFDPKNIYFIGCRGHNLGIEEVEVIENKGMKKLEAKEFINQKVVDDFLAHIITNHTAIYVSIDMDVLDPAFAPGVSVPEPGGLSTRELFYIIKKLAAKINCFEIVEVNPKLDVNEFTSKIACRLIFELLDEK